MSRAICHNCGCPSVEVVEIPGAPGTDGAPGASLSAIPPAAGDPEGVVTASPGMSYINTTDKGVWFKITGIGNTGWEKFIGTWLILLLAMSAMALPPILRGPLTTNTPTDSLIVVSNVAVAAIAAHPSTNSVGSVTNAQPPSTTLSNLASQTSTPLNLAGGTNMQPASLNWSGATSFVTNAVWMHIPVLTNGGTVGFLVLYTNVP